MDAEDCDGGRGQGVAEMDRDEETERLCDQEPWPWDDAEGA